MSRSDFKFDAFISYRRSDGSAVAHWLRRELQAFRVPDKLRERHGRPLKVYLDTAFERGTADFFEGTIKPNLLASRWLLVLATPDARLRSAGSEDWIQREVEVFAGGPNGRNVVAVRGAGEFNDPLPADLEARFPRIEIVDLRGAGRLSFLNPVRAARLSSEKLKIVAPLLDVPDEEMPGLRQEEERRQQTRLGATTGATLGVVTAVAGLSVWALQSQYRSARALDDTLFATGSMVVQSAVLVQGKDAAVDRTRRLLIAQGCDLLDKLRRDAIREPPIDGLVKCHLERALAREQVGEIDQASAALEEAVAAAEARHAKTGRRDAARYLIEASEASAAFFRRQAQLDRVEVANKRLLTLLPALQQMHSSEERFVIAEADTHADLAEMQSEDGMLKDAAASYDAAAAATERVAAMPAVTDVPNRLAQLAGHYRAAAMTYSRLEDHAAALERFRKAIAATTRIEAGKMPADAIQEAAVAYAFVADLESRNGNREAAAAARGAALAHAERVLAASDATALVKSLAHRLKAALERASPQ